MAKFVELPIVECENLLARLDGSSPISVGSGIDHAMIGGPLRQQRYVILNRNIGRALVMTFPYYQSAEGRCHVSEWLVQTTPVAWLSGADQPRVVSN